MIIVLEKKKGKWIHFPTDSEFLESERWFQNAEFERYGRFTSLLCFMRPYCQTSQGKQNMSSREPWEKEQ